MTVEERKAALVKILFDQNGFANSIEVVESLVELIKAIVAEDLGSPTP